MNAQELKNQKNEKMLLDEKNQLKLSNMILERSIGVFKTCEDPFEPPINEFQMHKFIQEFLKFRVNLQKDMSEEEIAMIKELSMDPN